MNGNMTLQSASPEVGSAPGSLGNIGLCGQSEVLKQVLGVIDKKVRNMEKKKVNTQEKDIPQPFAYDIFLHFWLYLS